LAEIAQAHVLVLPSRCFESYGLTLVEALAAGTNVLASDMGAMREVIQAAGVGYLFDARDPASLAAQLRGIGAAHAAGTLNRFNVSAFLAGRSEAGYLRGLLSVYEGSVAA
jgi:phosphatidyl-myo-inositol alpha-mannosyltransferase